MAVTDQIGDMLTRIRNAYKSKLINVPVPHSKMKCSVLDVLKDEGYIQSYEVINNSSFKVINILLKYSYEGKPAIQEIHRVSTPGKRVHVGVDGLTKGYYNNMGIFIISTSKGIISNRHAHQYNVGGEVICKVF
jgi:small subunit ribosomal protein S8